MTDDKIVYFCAGCKNKFDTPKWKDRDEKIEIGLCPRCGEEVSRRLKTREVHNGSTV